MSPLSLSGGCQRGKQFGKVMFCFQKFNSKFRKFVGAFQTATLLPMPKRLRRPFSERVLASGAGFQKPLTDVAVMFTSTEPWTASSWL